MMNTKFKNIKWILITAFGLGYFVATATAGPEYGPGDELGAADAVEAARPSSRWQPVEVDSSMPSSFRDRKPNVINRADALYGVFDILCHSGRPLRVLQLGDSHVAGGDYPAAVRSTLEEAWGKAENDTAGYGIVYKYIARNGATAAQFATTDRMKQVAAARPDLIILSFGTNECHGMGYREELHRVQLEDFYEMLCETCPEAIVMITTPPGDYLTSRRVTYVRRSKGGRRRRVVRSNSKVNPMSARCAAALESFGAEHNLAVWDLNTIVGGDVAVRNWTAAHMMRPDRIHFTAEGYQLHGRLLGEAILHAYNDYLTH